ncbi:hypothetical protein BDV97DRAFT_357983 [Delphinella strobiligena]|nr:hypothetical protein BDV97DRAFT_357983 [Delphinella strobiligena]
MISCLVIFLCGRCFYPCTRVYTCNRSLDRIRVSIRNLQSHQSRLCLSALPLLFLPRLFHDILGILCQTLVTDQRHVI